VTLGLSNGEMLVDHAATRNTSINGKATAADGHSGLIGKGVCGLYAMA